MAVDPPIALLSHYMADAGAGWSMGTFGAIAEFTRDADEPASLHHDDAVIGAVTARGGIRLAAHPDMRLIASESPTRDSWGHRVALCLPREICAMSGRIVLTELGADHDALREVDRDAVLFDLGLGILQIDVCIRSHDAELIAGLRQRAGRSIFAAGNDAMRLILGVNPHRVFLSRIGRAEAFQPIPPPGGVSPSGPHTHLLPKLLAHGRTHAATEPLPEGWIPCGHLYPRHPLRDQEGRVHPYDGSAQTAFQSLLDQYGEPALVALKRRVVDAVAAAAPPAHLVLPDDRFARAMVRVTLRQMQAAGVASATTDAWLSAHDRLAAAEPEDPMEAAH